MIFLAFSLFLQKLIFQYSKSQLKKLSFISILNFSAFPLKKNRTKTLTTGSWWRHYWQRREAERAADDATWLRRRRDHRPERAFLRTTNLYSPSIVLSISGAWLFEDCEHGLVLANLQILAPSFRPCCSPQGWRRCVVLLLLPFPAPVVAFRLISVTSSDSFFLFFLDVCSIHSWRSFFFFFRNRAALAER
jgi:hypothetical protein